MDYCQVCVKHLFKGMTFELGDMISRLNVAAKARSKYAIVRYTVFNLAILELLVNNGVFEGLALDRDLVAIKVFLKHFPGPASFVQFKLVSRPGRRVF